LEINKINFTKEKFELRMNLPCSVSESCDQLRFGDYIKIRKSIIERDIPEDIEGSLVLKYGLRNKGMELG